MESGKCGIPFPLHLKGCWCLHVEEAAKAHEEQNGPQGTCVAWCASQVDGVHDISQPSIKYTQWPAFIGHLVFRFRELTFEVLKRKRVVYL
jgi:hypothetical protein